MAKDLKILVIGGGGREHALAWKLARSPIVRSVYCAPGNPGIARHARCVPVNADALDALAGFAQEEGIGLAVAGPEMALTMGIADLFQSRGLVLIGPSREAARLEGSKAFAKELMRAAGIPTAEYAVLSDMAEAREHIRSHFRAGRGRLVLKADGLAAGKGVVICAGENQAMDTARAMLEGGCFGEAGRRIVAEECLEGRELSYIVLTDGEAILSLQSSRDHKRAFDSDQGPNTGGMGAYSPVAEVSPDLEDQIIARIFTPLLAQLRKMDIVYRGFLYAGIMLTVQGPMVLEFNVRLGDPEAQPLLMRLRSDLADVLLALAKGELARARLEWDPRPAVCVVMASRGYPGEYEHGSVIQGLDSPDTPPDVMIFHAGTAYKDGKWMTAGGRVLGVTALGRDLGQARERAYAAASRIQWEGVHYRRDIAV